jgi:accessory gene regulator protein AgrB
MVLRGILANNRSCLGTWHLKTIVMAPFHPGGSRPVVHADHRGPTETAPLPMVLLVLLMLLLIVMFWFFFYRLSSG